MTRVSLEELVEAVRPRYLRASRREKTQITDEFVAITGYHRKSAIRRLRHGRKRGSGDRRGRPPVYTNEVQAALIQVWEVCGRICSKRLAPFLAEMVAVLEREGELKLPLDTERLLVRMSPATIDRLLFTQRYRRPRCTTKPGTLLKHAIPIRTFADWDGDGKSPGFLELDLVAHCAESAAGEYRIASSKKYSKPQEGFGCLR